MTKQANEKSVVLVVGRSLVATDVPARSKPMEFQTEFQAELDKIQVGRAIELDSGKISEHRARKFLQILKGRDPRYAEFVLRTASSNTGRRRVFITRPVSITIAAGNGDYGSEGGTRP